jgi:hypothetical protein
MKRKRYTEEQIPEPTTLTFTTFGLLEHFTIDFTVYFM